MSSEIVKVMSRPDVQAKIIETVFIPRQISSVGFGAIHRTYCARMAKLIKGTGITCNDKPGLIPDRDMPPRASG